MLNAVQGSGDTAVNKIDKTQPSGNLHSLRKINFDLVIRKSVVEYLIIISNSTCPNLNFWVSLPQQAPPEATTISINGNPNFLVAQAENHESPLIVFQHLSSNPSRKSVCPTFKIYTDFKHWLPPPWFSFWCEPPSFFLLKYCRALLSELQASTLSFLRSVLCKATVDPVEMYQILSLLCTQLCSSFPLKSRVKS